MVYRNRRYNRRRRTPRRPRKPMRYRVADLAYKAYRGVRYIRGLVNSEKKHHDVTWTPTVNTTGTTRSLTSIAQGDGISTRDGNSILVKSLYFRMSSQLNSGATASFVRFIVFQDKQQVADTTPGVTDVLETADYLSHLNRANLGRFKILRDVTYGLDGNTVVRVFKRYIYLNTHIRYNGTASTDIQKNGLHVLAISNEATNVPTVDFNFSISYHDN